MTIQYKVIGCLVALLAAFAVGRFTGRPSAPAVHTIETLQTESETKTNKDTHKTTVITKKPGGEETTTITEDTVTTADRKRDSVAHLDQTVTPPRVAPLNLSILAGVDPTNSFKPVYGLSLSKQVLGPITVGVFGLTNHNVGVSLGLNF